MSWGNLHGYKGHNGAYLNQMTTLLNTNDSLKTHDKKTYFWTFENQDFYIFTIFQTNAVNFAGKHDFHIYMKSYSMSPSFLVS